MLVFHSPRQDRRSSADPAESKHAKGSNMTASTRPRTARHRTLPIRTALLAAVATFTLTAAAETLTVGPDPTQFDHPTVAAAIAAASTGDIIVIEPGLYFGELTIFSKDLTLRRSETPGEVILSGQGLTRVIFIQSAVVTLENLTITGGFASPGSAIYAFSNGPLTIEGCIIEDNETTEIFGAVYAGAPMTMRNTIVRNNTSRAAAGGIYLAGGGPHLIANCRFENNATGISNSSGDNGGAISVSMPVSADVQVIDTDFTGNTATGRGGAVSVLAGSARFDRCTFDSNSSPVGGAIWISDGDTALAFNCLFVQNEASGLGGAVFNEQNFTAVNSTFVGNADSTDGDTFEGARSDARTSLENCVVVNPSPGSHSGVGLFLPNYSIVPEAASNPDDNGNLNADPRFVDAMAGDYRLAADSPAIDAGNSFASATSPGVLPSLLVDLDGNTRNLNDPNTSNTGVPAWELNIDLGAYEFQPAPASGPGCSPADIAEPFGVVNFFDVSAYLAEFNAGCP
jgi:hypothetical protein